jgi:hypothetical protein
MPGVSSGGSAHERVDAMAKKTNRMSEIERIRG